MEDLQARLLKGKPLLIGFFEDVDEPTEFIGVSLPAAIIDNMRLALQEEIQTKRKNLGDIREFVLGNT